MDGAWDMFHCGHVAILKQAKERGDYLIVGVHGDSLVNKIRGANLPLMNLHERVLSVLGCRYVDDVVIDAPWVITPEMVASLNIAEVIHGSYSDDGDNDCNLLDMNIKREEKTAHDIDAGYIPSQKERYHYVMEAGIYTEIQSPTDFSLATILHRIQSNQQMFQVKIAKKKKAESEYYQEKYKGLGPLSQGIK
jgi:ethanolamine-phosphate cytidylyltransferase